MTARKYKLYLTRHQEAGLVVFFLLIRVGANPQVELLGCQPGT